MSSTPASSKEFEDVHMSLLKLTLAVKGITNYLDTLSPLGSMSDALDLRRNVLEFVPPITAIPSNGASSIGPPSLHSHFPNVKAAVIMAIIIHEFKAADLHKLDPTNCNKDCGHL
ncbi:hypothetical protein H0H87_008780 [Tephrocybe sp. NHM501043]|nr:hypothetical protein H0H87_008780 [Tephrocybe sp. NHM501043]